MKSKLSDCKVMILTSGMCCILHLEQVKGELLSGCLGRSEGLDIQYNLFSKKWISREDCFSDLWGFAGCLSGLASPIGQAGLPAWRTGKKVEPTPICMPACYVQQSVPGGEGKWRKQQLSISKIVKIQLAEKEEKKKNESWLVWLSCLSTGLCTKGSLVWVPVREHAWVADRSPVGGAQEAITHWCFSPSLSPFLPLSLKINK